MGRRYRDGFKVLGQKGMHPLHPSRDLQFLACIGGVGRRSQSLLAGKPWLEGAVGRFSSVATHPKTRQRVPVCEGFLWTIFVGCVIVLFTLP